MVKSSKRPNVSSNSGLSKSITLAAYHDIVSPTAKKIGGDIEIFYDTIRRAVLNPEIKSVSDRYKEFIEESRLRVEDDKLQFPPEQLLGPVLERIRYEPNGTTISKMFSELLSRGFDRERVGEAHPSFANIIGQLSGDEAKLLKVAWDNEKAYATVSTEAAQKRLRKKINSQINNNLDFPSKSMGYIDHIQSLGMIQFMGYIPPDDWTVFYMLEEGEINGHIGFTAFGYSFLTAVFPKRKSAAPV